MMEVGKLKEWIVNHQVEKRTLENFFLNFDNYMKEQAEEFHMFFGDYDDKYLDVYLKKIALMLDNFPVLDYVHVISYLLIEYKGKVVGEYRLLLTLDGEVYDFLLTLY
ncbi:MULTISPECIES: hypothetical protein [unclassified Paenibacillus]|uniref:hypothetical protein n=2 Tax=unclassified Paenibacillus TaxID=185978 RepID=UPI0024BB69D3|nr:hypothetical protein [Paenibacillus sp. RC343]